MARHRADDERPRFALPDDRPHYAPDRPADVRHVHLEVALDFERKSVAGAAHTTFAALFERVEAVSFDAAELDVDGVTLADGRTGLEHWTEGGTLHVRLDRPYAHGEQFGVVVRYHATPRSGLYFVGPDRADPERPVQAWSQGQAEASHFWFPCHDFPNERATTSLDATVPARFFALSNGRLEGVDEDPRRGTKTYRWRQDVPHAAYLVTLVVGEFVELRDAWRDVPVSYYVRPGREDDGRHMFAKTPAMMEFFSRRFGVDYPYAKYAQVVVEYFITGAMENTSATTHSFRLLADERARLDFSADSTVAHELVHQWFGDLLTCRDWGHAWLNEGFATYFELAWAQHDEGEDEYRAAVRANLQTYLEVDARGRRPIVYNVYRADGDEVFDQHVYEKASLVLHLLRFVLGEEPFWRAIQVYAGRHRGREVVTADLERAIEESTGRGMERFFAEWLYGEGHPEFRVTYAWDDARRMARVGVAQTQAARDASPGAAGGAGGVFHVPVEIAFAVPREAGVGAGADADGADVPCEPVVFRVELEEADQTFYLPLARRPLMVRFDPGGRIPKTLEFERPAEQLRFQLRRDDDVLGRIEAAEGLGRLGDPRGVETLASALLDEPFWAVRGAIADALGRQRSARALDALLAGLEHVSEPKARRAVVAALGEFRAPAGPDGVPVGVDGDAPVGADGVHPAAELAERAARALGAILERGEPSYYVEAAAATALGRTRTPGAFDRLVAVLDRPSWNEIVRGGVFAGLGELAEPRAVAIICEWLLDPARPFLVRQAAAGGLRALAGTHRLVEGLATGEERRRAVEAACAALDDPWYRVVLHAADALGDFDDPRAIPALERYAARALDDVAARHARRALAAIRRTATGEAREQETRSLRTEVERLRDEGRRLRERLDALEARDGARRGHARSDGRADGVARGAIRARRPGAGRDEPAHADDRRG